VLCDTNPAYQGPVSCVQQCPETTAKPVRNRNDECDSARRSPMLLPDSNYASRTGPFVAMHPKVVKRGDSTSDCALAEAYLSSPRVMATLSARLGTTNEVTVFLRSSGARESRHIHQLHPCRHGQSDHVNGEKMHSATCHA